MSTSVASQNQPGEPASDARHPYYIVAPPYIHTSAGIRVLHLICHYLNRSGQTAYIMLYPCMPFGQKKIAPDLLTPVLNRSIARDHFECGRTPILVYPEVVSGNPFGGSCVVRYVLNFPGLLGGNKEFAPEELCFSYSKALALTTLSPDNILFLPAIDTNVFRLNPNAPARQGTCFYAAKYKAVHRGELFDITKDSVEITRDLPSSQTPQELAELFQRSELFYCYENSALATEAVLCGCPAVFLPNPYLTEIIAAKELGPEGYAWGTDPAEIARAKATVAQGAQNYLNSYDVFWRDFDKFVALTQDHVRNKPYTRPIYVPTFYDTLQNIYRERGGWNFAKAALRKTGKLVAQRYRRSGAFSKRQA